MADAADDLRARQIDPDGVFARGVVAAYRRSRRIDLSRERFARRADVLAELASKVGQLLGTAASDDDWAQFASYHTDVIERVTTELDALAAAARASSRQRPAGDRDDAGIRAVFARISEGAGVPSPVESSLCGRDVPVVAAAILKVHSVAGWDDYRTQVRSLHQRWRTYQLEMQRGLKTRRELCRRRPPREPLLFQVGSIQRIRVSRAGSPSVQLGLPGVR